jgi:hypothetical protein
MKYWILSALAATILCASAAVAADHGSRSSGGDPNRVICRKVEETGSRLNHSRACHTAAEWDELRRQMKANVERIQNNRPANLS